MAELKTKPTDQSVEVFLNTVNDEGKKQDSYAILEMMKKVTGEEPRMWGDSMIGFGTLSLKYASGRDVDWFPVGFSPRKQNLTLYFSCDIAKQADLLRRLGKHKTGKGCLYINHLKDVDQDVLEQMIRRGLEDWITYKKEREERFKSRSAIVS
jgi:hypothetical protein